MRKVNDGESKLGLNRTSTRQKSTCHHDLGILIYKLHWRPNTAVFIEAQVKEILIMILASTAS